jgi:hypothetical protein
MYRGSFFQRHNHSRTSKRSIDRLDLQQYRSSSQSRHQSLPNLFLFKALLPPSQPTTVLKMVLAAPPSPSPSTASTSTTRELDYEDVISVQDSWECLKADLNKENNPNNDPDAYKKPLGEMCFLDPRIDTTTTTACSAASVSSTNKDQQDFPPLPPKALPTLDDDDDDDDDSQSCATSKSSYDPFLELKTSSFLRMLDKVVALLGPKLDHVSKALHDLGRQHVVYQVNAADYALIGNALLFTLKQHMTAWDQDMERAWKSAYSFISTTMIAGANDYRTAKRASIGHKNRPSKSVSGASKTSSPQHGSRPPKRSKHGSNGSSKNRHHAPVPMEIAVHEGGFFSRHFAKFRRNSANN